MIFFMKVIEKKESYNFVFYDIFIWGHFDT